ncbi:MAG: DUF1937 family protein [Fuerstiella sp.]|nr:DUF1937 family protein [Fuerstiella sp.]
MIYLASPYSHSDANIREKRFRDVCRTAARLMRNGDVVFSPIAHGHPIAPCTVCRPTGASGNGTIASNWYGATKSLC